MRSAQKQLQHSLRHGQFGCGTCILHVIHERDARATLQTVPLPGHWELFIIKEE